MVLFVDYKADQAKIFKEKVAACRLEWRATMSRVSVPWDSHSKTKAKRLALTPPIVIESIVKHS